MGDGVVVGFGVGSVVAVFVGVAVWVGFGVCVAVGAAVGRVVEVGVGLVFWPRSRITLCVLWLYWKCRSQESAVAVVVYCSLAPSK